VCSSDFYSVEISNDAILKCNFESCVKVVTKSNIQSKTTSVVPLRHVAILTCKHLPLFKVEYAAMMSCSDITQTDIHVEHSDVWRRHLFCLQDLLVSFSVVFFLFFCSVVMEDTCFGE
jgi:hypothetical protein